MEIERKARFVQRYLGGVAYLPGDVVVRKWLESIMNKLQNPKYQTIIRAANSDEELEKILKVFNVDDKGKPVVPCYQLYECSRNAHRLAGIWNKFKVSADIWKDSVVFQPDNCNLYNGKLVTVPDGVQVHAISTKTSGKLVSFFTAYQYINPGTEFTLKIIFPDDLISSVSGRPIDRIFEPDPKKSAECVNTVLDKMGMVGLGAFRTRFGKFEWI